MGVPMSKYQVCDPSGLGEPLSQRYLQGIEYINDSGTYVFNGWYEGHRPTQTFAADDWIGCLHGVMFGLLFLSEPVYSHRAIEDDGMLHEIVHIMSNEQAGHKHDRNINTYTTDRITNQLKELEKRTLDKYNQLVQEQTAAGKRIVHDFRPKAEVQQEEVRTESEGYAAEGYRLHPQLPVRVGVL